MTGEQEGCYFLNKKAGRVQHPLEIAWGKLCMHSVFNNTDKNTGFIYVVNKLAQHNTECIMPIIYFPDRLFGKTFYQNNQCL